jgi:hypothetical protein
MTDIVLRDIDPVLAERIKRISDKRGMSLSQTLLELLEHGLHAYEGDGAVRFDNSEADVLQAAIAALEGVPNDPGFALIGRAASAQDEPQAG